jgi:hypothetical protein
MKENVMKFQVTFEVTDSMVAGQLAQLKSSETDYAKALYPLLKVALRSSIKELEPFIKKELAERTTEDYSFSIESVVYCALLDLGGQLRNEVLFD